ncbi:MAG: hypothetical protein K8R87_01135 [Verrucomicrobia bacterium]|nr:hypothetical protein [Verrucomicrobiota bacterium]
MSTYTAYKRVALVCLLMIVAALLLALTSCTSLPDWTPDVAGHAASWGGGEFNPATGRMSASAPRNYSRKTMLHD